MLFTLSYYNHIFLLTFFFTNLYHIFVTFIVILFPFKQCRSEEEEKKKKGCEGKDRFLALMRQVVEPQWALNENSGAGETSFSLCSGLLHHYFSRL